jgi:hypothetical protein
MRLDEPGPVDHRQAAVERGDLAWAGEGALETDVRQLAQPEHTVDGDRIANSEAPPQPFGVVIGQLVNDGERPHLESEQRGISSLGAGSQHGKCEGAGGRGGDGHGRRDAQAAADERHDHRPRQRDPGCCPDGRAEARARAAAALRTEPRAQGA